MTPKDTQESFRKVFNTEDGKVVMEWLAGYCGYNQPSFTLNDPNALMTVWQDGKRAVYLQIRRWIDLELPTDEGSLPSADKRGAVGPTTRRRKING